MKIAALGESKAITKVVRWRTEKTVVEHDVRFKNKIATKTIQL